MTDLLTPMTDLHNAVALAKLVICNYQEAIYDAENAAYESVSDLSSPEARPLQSAAKACITDRITEYFVPEDHIAHLLEHADMIGQRLPTELAATGINYVAATILGSLAQECFTLAVDESFAFANSGCYEGQTEMPYAKVLNHCAKHLTHAAHTLAQVPSTPSLQGACLEHLFKETSGALCVMLTKGLRNQAFAQLMPTGLTRN